MNVLVLGAGGMAGHVIALRLKEIGYGVVGLARRDLPFCETIRADVTNTAALMDAVGSGRYDAVVNAVGVLPNAVERDIYNAIWINACLPHVLVGMTSNINTRVIHISTDCVFSGHDSGLYTENAHCSADDYYGRTKALGELKDGKHLTFRTSIVGPEINECGVGLFHWFMRQTGTIQGYRRAVWTGVTTVTLADAIDAALRHGLTGLYHLVNKRTVTKFDLLRLFNGLRSEPIGIMPYDGYVADKSLLNTRTDFPFTVRPYEDMIADMGEWIESHRPIYPLYNR